MRIQDSHINADPDPQHLSRSSAVVHLRFTWTPAWTLPSPLIHPRSCSVPKIWWTRLLTASQPSSEVAPSSGLNQAFFDSSYLAFSSVKIREVVSLIDSTPSVISIEQSKFWLSGIISVYEAYNVRIFFTAICKLLRSSQRVVWCARITSPKMLGFSYWKRAFWAYFRENWVYEFGHWMEPLGVTVQGGFWWESWFDDKHMAI
jgi:hypothetical protein